MENVNRLLPPLREDLAIVAGPADSLDGRPTWIIHDAVRHRFYRIGARELRILDAWDGGVSVQTLQRRLHGEDDKRSSNVEIGEIVAMVAFLEQNQLTQSLKISSALARKRGWLQNLLTYYLFFRIPLCTPDSFLQRLLPWTRFFYSSWSVSLHWLLFLIVWFMTMRQWDRFVGTVPEVFDTRGAVYLTLAMLLAQVVHELGHALMAKRFGVKVPTMGVAFLVMWPVLYTELSEVWKLSSRQQRLAIAKAGIKAELGLAVWATLLWNLWPDGEFREALFFLASTTWIMTLMVNASPFMRFDGYFILSDGLNIPNLHARAFAMGQWWLRQRLLGVTLPPPEPWRRGMRRFLIFFAMATWIYRLSLFVTIALMVYHFFFKLLGLFLLIFELAWFVVRPIFNELRGWGTIMKGQSWGAMVPRLAGWLLAAMVMVFYPWPVTVEMAAILRPERLLQVYPPQEGRVAEVRIQPGSEVKQGALMLRLVAPALELQLELSQAKTTVLQHRLELGSTTMENLENQASVTQQLAQELVRLEGLKQQHDKLAMTAPMLGRVVMVMDHLREGDWVGTGQPLLQLASPNWQVHGYVGEADLQKIIPGTTGRFYSLTVELPMVEVKLDSLAMADSKEVDLRELASVDQGPIPSRRTPDGQVRAEVPIYRSVLSLVGETPEGLDRVHQGTVLIVGGRESAWRRFFKWTTALWIRESSF
ncbi:MAG TPA: biotin/lipoyl-binding protein [Magnetococcales bacterium]|nr:biotin/lipoyl-binding protein [Magnetococcales bacterium]